MDFELPEDLKMIRSLAHDFVVNELKPLERDLLGRSAGAGDAQRTLPQETESDLVQKAKNAGLWGASVPEELGGGGLGTLANCVIEEELAQTVVPFNFGDVSPILFDCNGEQKEKYFTPAFNREKTALIALLEPRAREDLDPELKHPDVYRGLISTTARKETAGYILNGLKTAAGRPGPGYFAVVFALVQEAKPTCFLVEAGTPGFDMLLAGQHSPSRSSFLLSFSDCSVRESDRLGEEGNAFSLGRMWLPARRIVRGARVVGAAQRLLEDATIRAQTTQWFGKPVCERPSVRSALAEMATDIRACRMLVHEAAWKCDEKMPFAYDASMVKLFAAQTMQKVIARATHIYGGPNNITANPPWRDVVTSAAGNLTVELQKEAIARQLLQGLRA